MNDNRVFEVPYNRAPKEDGVACDVPSWSRDTHALARYYFENCHGEQWIAAAFSDGDGRVLRVTSSDVDWDTYETELGERETVGEIVMRLNLIMSPEEQMWLSAVLKALVAVKMPKRPRR
jgi:hypothetical protein